jgi:hypothetical protein
VAHHPFAVPGHPSGTETHAVLADFWSEPSVHFGELGEHVLVAPGEVTPDAMLDEADPSGVPVDGVELVDPLRPFYRAFPLGQTVERSSLATTSCAVAAVVAHTT